MSDERMKEIIGLVHDKLENATYATELPLPDSMHKAGLLHIINECLEMLKPFINAE